MIKKNEQSKGNRKLKVHRKFCTRAFFRNAVFPEISLCGKWLRNAGFDCGQMVKVSYEENKIIIVLEQENSPTG